MENSCNDRPYQTRIRKPGHDLVPQVKTSGARTQMADLRKIVSKSGQEMHVLLRSKIRSMRCNCLGRSQPAGSAQSRGANHPYAFKDVVPLEISERVARSGPAPASHFPDPGCACDSLLEFAFHLAFVDASVDASVFLFSEVSEHLPRDSL